MGRRARLLPAVAVLLLLLGGNVLAADFNCIADTPCTGSDDDTMYGSDGNDTISGYGGADIISGYEWNDTLVGDGGAE